MQRSINIGNNIPETPLFQLERAAQSEIHSTLRLWRSAADPRFARQDDAGSARIEDIHSRLYTTREIWTFLARGVADRLLGIQERRGLGVIQAAVGPAASAKDGA